MADISIDIRALNTASPEIAKLQKDVEAATKGIQESAKVISASGTAGMRDFARHTDATGKSLREVLGPVKLLAGGLASELNPALGSMVFGATAAARELRTLPIALAGAGIALTVATVAATAWVAAVGKSIEATVQLQHQVNTLDFSGIVSDLDDLTKRIEAVREADRRGPLQSFIAAMKEFQAGIGLTDSLLEQSVKKMQALEQVGGARMREITAQGGLRTAGPLQQFQQLEQARAIAFADEERFIRAQQESTLILEKQMMLERRLVELRAEAALGKERLSGVERSAILEERGQALQTIAAREALGFAANAESERAGLETIRNILRGAAQQPGGPDEQAEGLRVGQAAVEDIRRTRGVQTNALLAAEIALRKEAVGLTADQRLELTLTAIQQDKQLAVAQAEGKADQAHLQALAEMQAAMRTTIELEQHAEKTNPLAGLSAGIRDVVEEFTAAGELLRGGIRSVGADMAQGMSDTFFNVITGQFTKLSDVSRQFGLNVLRTLTDTLSKAAVGQIFKDFLGNSGLGGSQGFVRGLGVLGGGMSTGGLVEVGGQLFQSVAAGGGQNVLVPVSAGSAGGASVAATMASAGVGSGAGGGVGGGTGGMLSLFGETGSAIRAFLNTPLSSVAPSLFSGGAGALAAGGNVAEEAAALGIGGSFSGTATAGMTVGSALGAAAAVAGLAFTIYSGLSNPPTATNIATSAVSGAISGAILGSYFGPYGTAIGAVAGGLLGGGAAALGKEDPAAGKARQQAEVDRAVGAANALGGAVQATNSIDELFTLLVANNSGAVGGTSAVAIVSLVYLSGQPRVGEALFVGYPNPTYPVCTVEEFARVGGTSYVAVIQQGVDPSFLSGPNASLEAAVRSKIKQLNQVGSEVELSVSDLLTSPFGGAVRRSTTFRASQAKQFEGQQLAIEGPSLTGLTPAERVAFLRDLAKLDQDLNLNILFRDPVTDEIVSISATAPAV